MRLRNLLDMEPTWQLGVITRPVELQLALVLTRLSDSMLAPCNQQLLHVPSAMQLPATMPSLPQWTASLHTVYQSKLLAL